MMYFDSARCIVTGTIRQDKAICVMSDRRVITNRYQQRCPFTGKGVWEGDEGSNINSALKSVSKRIDACWTTFGSCRAREIQFSLNSTEQRARSRSPE